MVGSYWFRLKSLPKIFRHLYQIKDLALDGFREHVPAGAGGAASDSIEGMMSPVPARHTLPLYYEWFCTLLPLHDPDRIREPDWVGQWHADYHAGEDMTLY